MPKIKAKKEEKNKIDPKEIEKSEEKELDPDLLLGDEIIPVEIETEEEKDEDEDGIVLDDDEVDPFKDKWEE